jgi:hypothetical protein
MSHWLRKQFRRALMSGSSQKCSTTRKQKYSERQAKRMAGVYRGESRHAAMHAYECRFCEHWHIGHERSEDRETRYFPGLGKITIKHFH